MPVRKVTKSQIALLRPYLIGEQPTRRERPEENPPIQYEWDMHCPLHPDAKRSAQLNVTKGVWFCNASCGGGKVRDLIKQRSEWVPPPRSDNGSGDYNYVNGYDKGGRPSKPKETLSEAKVKGWHDALMASHDLLDEFKSARGLFDHSLAVYDIGWDRDHKCYTIPVRGEDGELLNIRRYQTRPVKGRRKMWGVEGANAPRLYPMSILKDEPESIIICEGELDALITIQNGFPAITRTGSAKTWRSEWNKYFKDKVVYLCQDCDEDGQDGQRRIGRNLRRLARDVRVVHLPYPITPKHGKDLTDYWLEREGDADEFRRLLEEATPFDPAAVEEPERVDDASVLDAIDSSRVGSPLRLTVTIKGKREPGYSIPRRVEYSCTRDAGTKCNFCPLYGAGGADDKIIAGSDPIVLEMIDSPNRQVAEVLRASYGIPKCPKLEIDVKQYQAVEILIARESIDHHSKSVESNGHFITPAAYRNIKVTSVGRHDTQPNQTVQVVGALQPDPRHQQNEFLAWDISRLETSLDRMEMDSDTIRDLRRFQPQQDERPLHKVARIARELEQHVTHIYGRTHLHAAIDLVFHSALGFTFAGHPVRRGWLELLVVGDTRTGKSEVAARIVDHYRAGEVVECESASFAGIIGGLQQYGASKEWAVTWGAVPINDRRLVVLDEISGLEPSEIAEMSSVRSSGTAQLTKIRQEETLARTRLIWMGNPRIGSLREVTYGVQAIQPLIGSPEDIARFDLAMSLRAGEVSATAINRRYNPGRLHYPSDSCNLLIRWAWSRTPDQIVWMPGSEDEVLREAVEMGKRYIEEPPLVQVANVREKIARIAVALAIRTFSTDRSGERVLVRRTHVRDAVRFIDILYSMEGFGYAERSRQVISERKEAEKHADRIKKYLYEKPQLAEFLRGTGSFRRQDLEEILNIDKEDANQIISFLWSKKMVRKIKGDIKVEPTMHRILREMRL
jgi:hypothetical protein